MKLITEEDKMRAAVIYIEKNDGEILLLKNRMSCPSVGSSISYMKLYALKFNVIKTYGNRNCKILNATNDKGIRRYFGVWED